MNTLKHNSIYKTITLELQDANKLLFHTKNELFNHHRLISVSLPERVSLSFLS